MSQALLDAIRKEAKPAMWAKGVKLARENAVVLGSTEARSLIFRVKANRPVPFAVTLHHLDLEWECDCMGPFDPCEHAVAAAIVHQQSATQGAPVATADTAWARVVYRFSRAEQGLFLLREIAFADGRRAVVQQGQALQDVAGGAKLLVEQCDLQVERLLERPFRGALPADRLDGLLNLLEPAKNVLLDGQPVAISRDIVLPRAVVDERDGALQVSIVKDPRVTEVVSPGVALCGETLCRLGETSLTGARLENLPSTRRYQLDQVGELTSRVLPELARRFPLQVKTRKLPNIDRQLTPRIMLELNQVDGAGLSVLPTLVYGAPPQVRIDAGKVVLVGQSIPLRNEAAEAKVVHQLREALELVPGRRMTVRGPEVANFAQKLRRWQGGVSGDAAGLVSPELKLKPRLQIREGAGGRLAVDFDFEVIGGAAGLQRGVAGQVDGAAVLRAYSEGLGLVPIEGGAWAPLPKAWLDQHAQQVIDLLNARAEGGALANHAVPALAVLCDSLNQAAPMGLKRLAPLVEGFSAIPPATLPEGLRAELRPYQRQGVDWLQFLKSAGLGGVLADDMGLGKTLQTICALGPRSLVVCPTSVLPNWRRELQRFRPNLKICTYHGPSRALDDQPDVTLTSYALLRLDAQVLQAREWQTVVLDEAQAIKNPESQAAQAAFGLKAEFKLAVSGTPVENSLDELWSVMHFANPGLLGGRSEFEERWARPIEAGQQGAAAKLRTRIRPFLLRRLKREVAPELPERTESVLHVTLEDRERAVYDSVYAATRNEVVALLESGGSVFKALEALLRLRQAACHSALVPGQQASSSSKMKALVEALATAAAEGHKSLVFSQWTSLLDLIEPELKQAGLTFNRLDGATADRAAVTSEFQADTGPQVMLLSLKAGGTGLNLTAADHVFLVDPWWNPAVEAQAADRAHRIGQKNAVNIYRLVAECTIEEKILNLQQAKRALFEAALGDGESTGVAAGLSRDDLMQLFA